MERIFPVPSKAMVLSTAALVVISLVPPQVPIPARVFAVVMAPRSVELTPVPPGAMSWSPPPSSDTVMASE